MMTPTKVMRVRCETWNWCKGGPNITSSLIPLLLLLLGILPSPNVCHLINRNVSTETDSSNESPWRSSAETRFARFKKSPFYGASKPHAKNAIVFIGDGMGLNTVTAARYLKAQLAGAEAGESQLLWDSWPTVSLVQTFSADRMTTDSGAAATAFLAGVKAPHSTLGVKAGIKCCTCSAIPEEQRAISSLVRARQAGLSVGVVTTTTITHATPAAAYAHTNFRMWEFAADNSQGQVCEDIASQLVRNALDFNVLFGGGAEYFYPNSTTGPFGMQGKRTDGRDLLTEWRRAQASRNRSHRVIHTAEELASLTDAGVQYVFGTFAGEQMNFDVLRGNEPSLSEMTEAAIRVLSQNTRGYLLLVEGGRIDHAHHANHAQLSITDTLAFERAVQVASKLVSPEDTLMLVTADHSHSFGVVGYATRGRSIFDTDDTKEGDDGMPYLIAGYFNGPGATVNQSRINPLLGDRFSTEYRQQSLVPLEYSTHSPEDVPLYSTGPFNQLFSGVQDNTFISYATSFVLCVPPYHNQPHCLVSSKAYQITPTPLYLPLIVIILQVIS